MTTPIPPPRRPPRQRLFTDLAGRLGPDDSYGADATTADATTTPSMGVAAVAVQSVEELQNAIIGKYDAEHGNRKPTTHRAATARAKATHTAAVSRGISRIETVAGLTQICCSADG